MKADEATLDKDEKNKNANEERNAKEFSWGIIWVIVGCSPNKDKTESQPNKKSSKKNVLLEYGIHWLQVIVKWIIYLDPGLLFWVAKVMWDGIDNLPVRGLYLSKYFRGTGYTDRRYSVAKLTRKQENCEK